MSMSGWYFSVRDISLLLSLYFRFSLLLTFFGCASFAAFIASCSLARGRSPVKVTSPFATVTVTPVMPYLVRFAVTCVFSGSSAAMMGGVGAGLAVKLLVTDLTP